MEKKDRQIERTLLNIIINDKLNNELSSYFNSIAIDQHVTDTRRFTNSFNETHLLNNYPMYFKHLMPFDGQGENRIILGVRATKQNRIKINIFNRLDGFRFTIPIDTST